MIVGYGPNDRREGVPIVLTKRVLIVDDHPMFRAGIRRAVESGEKFKVVGEAGCAYEAIDVADIHRPEVILLDCQLPGISGLKVARILRRKHPRARIVLFSMFGDEARVVEAIHAGAVAMLPRDIAVNALLEVLDRVVAGEHLLRAAIQSRPVIAQRARAEMRVVGSKSAASQLDALPLSTRELAVLDCAAQGLSNKQIATALYVTEQTVKNHFTSVLRKLEAEDRVGAILHAVKHGWVEIGPPTARTDVRWLLAHPAHQPATRVPA